MSTKLMSFFIPTRISPKIATQMSRILVGDLRVLIPDLSAEIYLTTAILYNSWCESESSTIKGLIYTIKELNRFNNPMSLAEKITKNKDIFRDPSSGQLSVEMLEVQSMLLHCLAILAKSAISFDKIQTRTLHNLKIYESSSDEEVAYLVDDLENLKRNPNFSIYEQNLNQHIEDIIKKVGGMRKTTNLLGMVENQDNYNQKMLSLDSKEEDTSNKIGVQLFSREQAIKAAQKIADAGQEANAIQKKLLFEMGNDNGFRELSQIPENHEELLADMYNRFPHFVEVIDFIEERMALASCGSKGKSVKMAPMLLKGPPGTGKTYFAQELARYLNLHFVEKDLSITSEAFVIAGMDSGWKNSKPGVVFDALVNNQYANPLICLNEIDKCQQSIGKNSPLTTLHWLLEPTSSYKFQDEFIPVDIRADHIVWVLTANDGYIPDPILSRLDVFEIKAPNKEQCRLIAKSVWKSLCEKEFPEGHDFPMNLQEDILDKVSEISPRIMRKTLTQAAAIASKNKRKFLLVEDLEKSLLRYKEDKKNPIGFN